MTKSWEVPEWAARASAASNVSAEVKELISADAKERERIQETISDAILTLKSLKLYMREIEEKANVCWREMENEIQALEQARGKK